MLQAFLENLLKKMLIAHPVLDEDLILSTRCKSYPVPLNLQPCPQRKAKYRS